ncbi:hypothetical protein Tco_1531789 [Tanacetum coccineum]
MPGYFYVRLVPTRRNDVGNGGYAAQVKVFGWWSSDFGAGGDERGYGARTVHWLQTYPLGEETSHGYAMGGVVSHCGFWVLRWGLMGSHDQGSARGLGRARGRLDGLLGLGRRGWLFHGAGSQGSESVALGSGRFRQGFRGLPSCEFSGFGFGKAGTNDPGKGVGGQGGVPWDPTALETD